MDAESSPTPTYYPIQEHTRLRPPHDPCPGTRAILEGDQLICTACRRPDVIPLPDPRLPKLSHRRKQS